MTRKTRRTYSQAFRNFRLVQIVSGFILAGTTLYQVAHKESGVCQGFTEAHSFITIVLLTMNRTSSLENTLESLQQTVFCGDYVRLIIQFDKGQEQERAIEVAEMFRFKHGQTEIVHPTTHKGLAKSWLHAWRPTYEKEIALILEDDILLSPFWYIWLREAWKANIHREDLAGISLQRQTLIPYKHGQRRSAFKSTKGEFLYTLVGSIGFSPHPKRWSEFLEWVEAVDLMQFEASVSGLITTDWWENGHRQDMWTQLFIYFSLQRQLFTLYYNPPSYMTLAGHTRAHGVHFEKDVGIDFEPLTTSLAYRSGTRVPRFTWNGERLQSGNDNLSKQLILSTLIDRARAIMQKNGFVYMMFLNQGYATMALNWICHIQRSSPSILPNVIFVVSDFKTAVLLRGATPRLHVFVQESDAQRESTVFGTYEYYSVVAERIAVQNQLIQTGVSIQIIEPDQIWIQDISATLRHKLLQHEVVAGDETVFTGQLKPKICGGFYGMRSTEITRRLFNIYTSQYVAYLQRFSKFQGKPGRIPHFEDDQVFLTRLLRENDNEVAWLTSCEYANGLWFDNKSFRESCPTPVIVHNNFVVGVEGKIGRAIFHNFWFLTADARCQLS